jgi:hypothetical protein
MAEKGKPWLLRPSNTWTHFRAVPFNRLWMLMVAVFFIFSVVGFFVDLVLTKGQMPYAVVLAIAATSGLNAILWIIVLARLSKIFLFGMIVLAWSG